MERREFLGKSGCSLLGLAAGGGILEAAQSQAQTQAQPQSQGQTPPAAPAVRRPRYKIDIEIFEARTDTWCHKKGDKFAYPADWGKLCPWLRASLNEFVRMLEMGVTLGWMYENTPYQKVIDPNGVTTEFVRCPDPTSNLVAKITRTKVG
ncbi:MAG: hypothetical protein NTZ26_01805 [Candidatus Aminicenantes bacterium]|nr:hypothetical protein [Candidatus Aminicenantes bacterium]